MDNNVNEMQFESQRYGLLAFIPTRKKGFSANCLPCMLFGSLECQDAKCLPRERSDGKQGYYGYKKQRKGKRSA